MDRKKPQRTTRLPRWLSVASFAVIQVVLVGLLLEGSVRLLENHHPGLTALLYTPSIRTDFDDIHSLKDLMKTTVVGFRPGELRAGFFRNSRGFRTREYTGPRPHGVLRIMAVGDSFTDASGGVPFDAMWPTRLEAELEQRSRRAVEVFALGVPGAGPRFELRLWELESPAVRPDLVVVAFFVGNDFTDERLHRLEPWSATAAERSSYLYRLLRNLNRQRQVMSDIRRHRASTGALGGGEAGPLGDLTALRTRTPEQYTRLVASRLRICERTQRDQFLEVANEADQVLQRFSQEVRAAGRELVVMIIPAEFQLNPELLTSVSSHLGLASSDIDLDLPQKVLTQRLAAAGIPYLDLLPDFRAQSRERRLYWLRNTHWNEEGHALAAQLLAEFLSAEILGKQVE